MGFLWGVRRKSGEIYVATKGGEIKRARSVRRIPVEDRWSLDNINWVRGVPWNFGAGDEDADGEIPEEKLAEAERGEMRRGGGPEVIVVNTREKEPR